MIYVTIASRTTPELAQGFKRASPQASELSATSGHDASGQSYHSFAQKTLELQGTPTINHSPTLGVTSSMTTSTSLRKYSMVVTGAALAVTFATNAAPGQAATVVNFDDLSGQGLVPDGYGGIDWGNNGWSYYEWSQPPYNAASASTRIYSYLSNPAFSFKSSPVVFDGAYFAGYSDVAFDLFFEGSRVFTSSSLTSSEVPTFLSSGYSGLVDEVHVLADSGYYVMDNVTYSQATAVPTPALLPGLVGLGLGVLRKRKDEAAEQASEV